jgi:hypothetical protein
MLVAAFVHTSRAETVIKSPSLANAPVALPPLVATFVEATNSFDVERLMTTFAEDALVNDQLRDYWGKPAIREWAERDIVGERLTMKVTKVVNHYGNFIVMADVDGNYDKRGLPDPLVLGFYFTGHSNVIVQLMILRNRYDMGASGHTMYLSDLWRAGVSLARRS